MRIEKIIIILLILTILVAALSNVVQSRECIVVTAPIEKYALEQVLPKNYTIITILTGNVNPHYIPVKPRMISKVKMCQIYIPLWHFSIEYRLIKYAKIVTTLKDYEKNGLKFLKYPYTDIVNSHGWWLYPENMKALIKSTLPKLCIVYRCSRDIVEIYYRKFDEDIEKLEQYLKYIGERIKIECPGIVIVCTSPALQYLAYSMNISCIVIREGLNIQNIFKYYRNRKFIILMASFQKGTRESWYFKDLIRGGRGVIIYVPILGDVNVNYTYTGFLYTLAGEIYGACISLNNMNNSFRTTSENYYTYILYVLSILLSICLVIIVGFLRSYKVRYF